MSAEASKAKAHKMSTAELIHSATSAGPRSISDNADGHGSRRVGQDGTAPRRHERLDLHPR